MKINDIILTLKLLLSKIVFYLNNHEKNGENEIHRFPNRKDTAFTNIRLIAFYLPQFHPIPENDLWWGQGFTEWTNVKKAKPLFPGHRQPKSPTELGYYDLRDASIRELQAKKAKEAGIEGFCYWHYWFGNGRRLLERPFQEVLSTENPDFPFCLAWANETWTGKWHGLDNQILIKQEYPGIQDYLSHFNSLKEAFSDKRYIKVNGRNLFLIYRPFDLPDPSRFVKLWRELAHDENLPDFYFIGINQHPWVKTEEADDLTGKIFDGFVTNGPNLPEKTIYPTLLELVLHKLTGINLRLIFRARNRTGPEIFSYRSFVKNSFNSVLINREYPLVLPNWDNTPRSGRRGMVLKNSSPELFQRLLRKAIQLVIHRPKEEQFVFIKSWNEWAEGNYLEPDNTWGHGYLEIIKMILSLKH